MAATLFTKLQQKQYREIVQRFGEKESIVIEQKDAIRMKDMLDILDNLGYIQRIEIVDGVALARLGEFSDFDAWYKDKKQEERMLSRREWKIAIFSAVIGALFGALPSIIELFI